ncbi:H-NS histone family protein [Massilia oculi]|uniref:H-NS histone family protein n=1 Tax=Massilia hydrophila TaxID=3044279 RepID=A0ABS7YE94_9BURK|nr:H-NS histone family protein [Massilia oculi]MCA1858023.1 H-NS histone family protein [Massilia oculi]
MDLSNLSISDLRNLQEQIKQEMKTREVQEVQKAREQILAIAQSVGVPLKDLLATGGRGAAKGASNKGNTVAVRFRHPDNASQQWTGRGRQPKWVKEWVEGGKSLDKLRV